MHPTEALSPTDVFGARVVAFVLDIVLVLVSAGPLAGGSGWAMAAVFFVVYFGLLQGVLGFTPAKAVLGLRVVKAGKTEKAGLPAILVRTLIAPVDLVAAIVFFIIDPRRRRLGDRAAGTEVVGIPADARTRALSGIGYVVLLSLLILFSSVSTFLIVEAIFLPVAIGFAVVILGMRRVPTAWPWLAGIVFTLPAAAYMSFASLCHRGEKTCVDLSGAHKAIPALILLVIAIGAIFVLRGLAAHAAVAVLVAAAELWMFLRLRKAGDMKFGAVVELLLLVLALLYEFAAYTARKRAAQLEAVTAS